MTEEKATRRRLTDAEKLERAKGQQRMIEERMTQKNKDRVVEALGLLAPLAETDSTVRDATGILAAWLRGVS